MNLGVKVSSAYARIGNETRQHRDERIALNNAAFAMSVRFNPRPRLVKPEASLRAISLAEFLSARPAVEPQHVALS